MNGEKFDLYSLIYVDRIINPPEVSEKPAVKSPALSLMMQLSIIKTAPVTETVVCYELLPIILESKILLS